MEGIRKCRENPFYIFDGRWKMLEIHFNITKHLKREDKESVFSHCQIVQESSQIKKELSPEFNKSWNISGGPGTG